MYKPYGMKRRKRLKENQSGWKTNTRMNRNRRKIKFGGIQSPNRNVSTTGIISKETRNYENFSVF